MADLTRLDFSHLQDVMGNLPMVKRYTVLCLCFQFTTSTSIPQVEDSLQDALARLTAAFPFLAGRVIYEDRDAEHSGVVRILPSENKIPLITKDVQVQLPSITELSKAGYPFSMLDRELLVPPIVTSWASDNFDMIAPVLVLQANFITGGMILTFASNHATMDMTGLAQVISLLSKACRDDRFSEQDIQQGNQPRANAIPLLGDDYQPGPEVDDIMTKPATKYEAHQPPRWTYFNIKAENLTLLKAEASKQTIVPYISTDDAIGALFWQHIMKARSSYHGQRSQFCRVIEVRRHFNLKGYLGHLVDCVYTSEVDVWKLSLGEVAGRLRQIVMDDSKIRHHAQAFATLLDRFPDKSRLINGANLDIWCDLPVSSYANNRCCELSFGSLLGKPEVAVRPRMPAVVPGMFIMPKARNGGIAVACCLAEDEIDRLREDPVFSSYADYIG